MPSDNIECISVSLDQLAFLLALSQQYGGVTLIASLDIGYRIYIHLVWFMIVVAVGGYFVGFLVINRLFF